MKKGLLLILFFSTCFFAGAQKGAGLLKGRLTDSTLKRTFEGATIAVILASDSSLVTFALTDKKGIFEINHLIPGNYIVFITYQGFQPVKKDFHITLQNTITDLGIVKLEREYRSLEEIVITSEAPITIRGDTIQFKADAFKTMPNSTAEDLLKKLPGVQVDNDGNVKVQGKDIKKIYVDGKEFFAGDPKQATRNITNDMVESIQVYDDMSDKSKFSRIDDGSREKTINLKLKKATRKSYFGRATVGAGTNNRYESALTFNRFYDTRRITISESSNNLNKGYALNTTGPGGGPGITHFLGSGVNYTDKLGSKIDVTASYSNYHPDSRTQQTSYRETTFFNDSVTRQNTESISTAESQNHRFNLRFEYYIDSLNSLLYTAGSTFQHSNNVSNDSSSTTAVIPGMKYLANTSISRYEGNGRKAGINNEILYRRRFNRPGRTYTLGFSNSMNNGDGNGLNDSPVTFYNADGSVERIRIQHFITAQLSKSTNNVLSTSYTEPLGNNKIIELNYAYTNYHAISDRDAFDYDPASKKFDSINRQQTNNAVNNFSSHRGGANFKLQSTTYNLQAGIAIQYSDMTNKSVHGIYAANGKDSTILTSQIHTDLFPSATFSYNFTKSKNLRINYSGRTNQPRIDQLENVLDFTNPLQVRGGNPGLKQEFVNSIELNYQAVSPANAGYLNISATGIHTAHKIVNSIDSLPVSLVQGRDSSVRGVQFIRPTNLSGAFYGSLNITWGTSFKKMKGSSINFTGSVSYNRNVSVLYGQKGYMNVFLISQSTAINIDIREKLNMALRASLSYNNLAYSFGASRKTTTGYFTQFYSAEINYYISKSLIASTAFYLTLSNGRAPGYNQAIPSWRSSLAKQLFKKKNGEIKLLVNDILNQAQRINRTQGENYFYDSRTVVLQRYLILTFTYNLLKAISSPAVTRP